MSDIMLVGAYNVEATISAFFKAEITATTFSSLFTSRPPVITDWALITNNVPSFALVYIPVQLNDLFQGRVTGPSATDRGGRQRTILEISSWVSTNKSPAYMSQLREMRDTIHRVFSDTPQLTVYDYRITPAAPTATPYKVNIDLPNEVAILRDENPALYRSRSLLAFSYITRLS